MGENTTTFRSGTHLYRSPGVAAIPSHLTHLPERHQRGAHTLALDLQRHAVFLPTAEFGPAPAPTPEQPRPRPAVAPGSFVVLVLGR